MTKAYSAELSVGMSAMEEGDDRQRLGTSFSLELSNSYYSKIFYFQRNFGPVSEKLGLISISKKFKLFNSRYLSAGVGANVLVEDQSITYTKAVDQAYNLSETQYNLGAFTGIYFKHAITSKYSYGVSWESALYPAGLGGILLSTARKQFISLDIGVRL